jgi:hypothetical protein
MGDFSSPCRKPGSDGSAPDPQGFRNLAQASTLSLESRRRENFRYVGWKCTSDIKSLSLILHYCGCELCANLRNMFDFYIPPMFFEVFRDQSAMTMMGFFLTTE